LLAAGRLARESLAGEIDRLSPAGRAELARRARCAADAETLKNTILALAEAATETEIAQLDQAGAVALQRRLRQIRAGVEPLPDDRARGLRRIALVGAALPVAIGVDAKERELREDARREPPRMLERAALWRPAEADPGAPLGQFAPLIAVEWPERRDYPEDVDRIGRVALAGTRARVQVLVQPEAPLVYTYLSTARIHGRRHQQLNYVWWFSDRPALVADDPVAGHIDGGTLRVTLDAAGRRAAVAEVILNCGCGHVLYVADWLEAAARREFGPPEKDARYAVERTSGRYPVLVAGVFDSEAPPVRPVVLLAAGSHEPLALRLAADEEGIAKTIVERRGYALCDYDALDRLPLEDGVASMFGPDGLVHFAGRREGFLLAPSGILSAGQPRKRGTQRIRWDEYLFDDPALLARGLRFPIGGE